MGANRICPSNVLPPCSPEEEIVWDDDVWVKEVPIMIRSINKIRIGDF
jgi:hypothetical protein